MPHRRSFLGAGAAVVAAAALPRTARAADRITAAIGPEFSMIYLPWYVAKGLRYFEREGLDAQIQFVASGSAAATALASGSVDFGGCGVDHAVAAQLRGKYIPLVIQFMDAPGAAVLIRPGDKAKFTSFKDLSGRNVGVSALGAGSHVLGVWLAKTAGLPKDDVKFIGVGGGPTAAAALESNRVDAVVAYDPLVTSIVSSGRGVAMIDINTPEAVRRALALPAYAFSGTLTREDVIKQSPERVQRVVNALVRALKFIRARPASDVARSLPDEMRGGLSLADWQRSFEHSKPAFTAHGEMSVDGLRGTAETNLFLLGETGAKLDYARLFDARFVDAANRTVH